MNIQRLEHLKKLLASVDVNRFDLLSWESDCKTTACAGGWAAKDPWFNELGLVFDPIEESPSFLGVGGLGYDALANFFELSISEARQIFAPDAYVLPESLVNDADWGVFVHSVRQLPPSAVIQRIDEMLDPETETVTYPIPGLTGEIYEHPAP